MTKAMPIWLPSWIIQDGNYGDFTVGDRRAFALEFWPTEPLTPAGKHDGPIAFVRREGGARYRVQGALIHSTEHWWALDAGVRLFRDGEASPPFSGRELLRATGYLAVDHFSYFERLSLAADAPALIYDWDIVAIDLGPSRQYDGSAGGRAFLPDEAPVTRIERTRAWHDLGGQAEYLLHCVRVEGLPRKTLRC